MRAAFLWTSVLLFFSTAHAVPMQAVLALKARISMQSLADQVIAKKHQFYSPTEIRAAAGPAPQDYANLLSSLKARGFRIEHESPTSLWVSVQGDHQLFESTFQVGLLMFDGARGEHQNMLEPRIPSDLSLIESISGLDTTRHPRSHLQRAHSILGSQPPVGISPDTIKQTYGFTPLVKAGLTGKGQHIAIATFNGFNIKNVQEYYQKLGLNPAPVVDIVTFNGVAKYDGQSAAETELDSEFSGMMAPGAQIHVFASATEDDPGELAIFTAILDDNRAKIVNFSWGDCENHILATHMTQMNEVFARAVAQGVNIMVASGDSGSDSCQDGTQDADYPAANPNVVAVGGTTLTPGQAVYETGWSGSGGGISGVWPLPAWQKGLGASFVRRSYPDVSFNADPNSGQAIYTGATTGQDDSWMVVGGTSMAAPQWAGFLALVGEARSAAGKSGLGYLNPYLYSFSSAQRKACFNDVSSGSNGAFSAGVGWDAVTGFGSMHAGALSEVLVGAE